MIGLAYARSLLIAAGLLAVGFSAAVAQEDEAFMPKGGKTVFLELKEPPRAAELREIGNLTHTEAEWRGILAERHKQLGERELNELAAYLTVNFPLPEGAVAQAESRNDIAAAVSAASPWGKPY